MSNGPRYLLRTLVLMTLSLMVIVFVGLILTAVT